MSTPLSRRLVLITVLITVLASAGAGAGAISDGARAKPAQPSQPQGPLSANEARAVRAVIQAQLDAFAADDAKRAFSFAASSIRELFGTADNFMQMVRGSYPVVYRPNSVTFLKPERSEQQVLQAVQMTDSNGKMWLALYSLQLQPDRSWRIAGCQIVANDGRSI